MTVIIRTLKWLLSLRIGVPGHSECMVHMTKYDEILMLFNIDTNKLLFLTLLNRATTVD